MNGPLTYIFSWKSIIMHFQKSRLKFGKRCKREIRVSDKDRGGKRLKIIFFFSTTISGEFEI